MVKCEKITEVHAMSVNDLLEQAKQLSPDERRELAQRLLDIDDASPPDEAKPTRKPRTGESHLTSY